MLNKFLANQGNIALVLVIMITSLTLVSAVALTLVNVSEKLANYHLTENEDVLNQKQTCLDEALLKISNNLYATGTYALDLSNVHCYYQMSETISGFKTVTTTASSLSALGAWSQSAKAIINVSSTPISIDSYNDIVGATWDSTAWSRRIKISVSPNKVAGDLYNFPVFVDLADLGTDFFLNTQIDGGDVVVTAGDATTKLIRELKSGGLGPYGTGGALYFLAPYLSSSVATDFYIYFGNASSNETNDVGVWTNYQMIQHLDDNPNTGDGGPHERDSTDNGNDLTTVGSIPNGDWVNAQVYRGIDFDAGDYFTVGSYNDFSSAQGTISFWLNFNTVQDTTLFHLYETITTDYIRSYYNQASNYLDLLIEDGDVSQINVRYMSPNTTGWHKIDWLQDGSSVKLYFDGQLKSLTEVVQSGSWWTNHLNFTGARIASGSWGSNLIGLMDEFRISDKAMSADWLLTEYNNQYDTATFYTTSTIETIGCSGVSMFDYCWYKASYDSMSCDDVCAENNLSCVSGVSYSDPTCSLNIALGTYGGGNCSGGAACIDGTGLGLTYSPANHVSADACIHDAGNPAYDCATVETSGVYQLICACQ